MTLPIDYHELVKPDRVKGDVYVDAGIFQDEMDRIYGQSWIYIGHESEIPLAGDYKLKTLGLQEVIFCRDAQANVQVMFNRCRHRAATVCQEMRGNCREFRCEYHGWVYGLDGSLKIIPYADGYADLDKTGLGLAKPPKVDSYRGFVFALADNDVKLTLDDHLGEPARQQIDLFCDLSPVGEIEVQAGSSLLAFNGNWKLQMENSIDGYHPNFTHQSFFQGISKKTGQRVDMFDGGSDAQSRDLGRGHSNLEYSRYNLAETRRNARLTALRSTPWGEKYYQDMVAAYGIDRAEHVIVVGGTHMSVFPNLVVLGQQVRTIRPVSPERTEVDLAPALLKGVPDELNTMRLRMYEQFYSPRGGGIHDDIEMFNRVGKGLRCNQEPWLLFKRGLGREQTLEDGTVVGQVTDEVPQRAMWRHWLELMT
jgi:phenylpropionate dioxygenase-like ring-hydroxylating dioxygenase large terminal subunit